MQTEKLEVKQTMTYDQALNYLEDLLACLRSGKVVLQQGDEYVSMEAPEDSFGVTVKAKQKNGKAKFSMEMSWMERPQNVEPLTISDKAPEAAVPAVKTPAAPPAPEGPKAMVKTEDAPKPATKPADKPGAKSEPAAEKIEPAKGTEQTKPAAQTNTQPDAQPDALADARPDAQTDAKKDDSAKAKSGTKPAAKTGSGKTAK